ncbi:hypothetical protein [Streptomyces tsukubensis]|uniref:Uncharacterized protein n=1 Tax=Streptomyces tsukubensis TaxID=83656 RepID=A0A1V4AC32_9ACTN|nr:hypothetical protein [Streptomyces tsukubensis]OON81391.1 hypothetical protein B1H18_08710 [Streptomyces tsukubensis]QFR95480.1 hypothetical protein GBW32_23720 [Streptomyces tsukubensis]
MSDLKKDAESLHKAATALGKVEHHTRKPLHAFRAASHDLSAFGALGALMGAKDDIEEGMDTIAKFTRNLHKEWASEATFMGDVSDAFDLLDILLSAAARAKKG